MSAIERGVVRGIINTISGEGEKGLARKAAAGSFEDAAGRIVKRINVEKALQDATSDTFKRSKLAMGPLTEGFLMARPDAKATILMPHGFTAWALQYKELARKLFDEGFNVYAPRLPGHGFMTKQGMLTGERMIQSTNKGEYLRWTQQRFKEAQRFNLPVHLLGQSGGSDLALLAAEKLPVEKTFAMVPFLGPNKPLKYGTDALMFLDKLTFGLVGRIMDRIPRNANTMADALDLTPHTNRSFGSALAIGLQGAQVKQVPGALQVVTTHGDQAAGTDQVKSLFERIGWGKNRGWFHFPAEDKVPHAMVSELENPNQAAVQRLHQLAVDFFKSGKLVDQLPEGVKMS